MKYDYLKNIKEDVKNYIEENKENKSYNFNDKEEVKQLLYDDLWIDDSVTGNGSGSYYCNSYKARESLQGNEDLLIEALEEFGNDAESYKRSLTDPEFADVTIRCYLLSQAIDEVVEEMTTEKNKTRIKITKTVEIKQDGETTKKELYHDFTNALDEAIKKLNSREKLVLDLRFYKGRTQIEVAEEIGISQAQVSRIEKNALKNMKKYI